LQKRWRRRHHTYATAFVAAVVLAAAIASPTGAGGKGAIVVRGVQHEPGSCDTGNGYLMTGPLDGCWWIDPFDVHRPQDTDKSHNMRPRRRHGAHGQCRGAHMTSAPTSTGGTNC
jgi:hypothetical protein